MVHPPKDTANAMIKSRFMQCHLPFMGFLRNACDHIPAAYTHCGEDTMVD
jgi:hypothetical protein